MSLFQIYQWVRQWKNFENRLTFGEVMGKSLVSCFFWDTVSVCRVIQSYSPGGVRWQTGDRHIITLGCVPIPVVRATPMQWDALYAYAYKIAIMLYKHRKCKENAVEVKASHSHRRVQPPNVFWCILGLNLQPIYFAQNKRTVKFQCTKQEVTARLKSTNSWPSKNTKLRLRIVISLFNQIGWQIHTF